MVIMNLLKGEDGPVHGEEEMVDADGDGIPLWGVETARAETFPCGQQKLQGDSSKSFLG